MLFGTYATGHKGETYDLSTGFNLNRVLAGPVRPETSHDYEIGARIQFLDRRITANLTLFDTHYSNFQAQGIETLPDGTVNYRLTNVGKLETRGVELETSARATDDLSLGAAVTYLHARINDFPLAQCYPNQTAAQGCTGTPARQDLSGATPPQAPTWKLTGSVDYAHDLGPLPFQGLFQASYTYQTKINYSLNQDPETVQGGYTIVNLSAGIRNRERGYELIFFVNNLFDKQYFENLTDSRGNYGGQQATRATCRATSSAMQGCAPRIRSDPAANRRRETHAQVTSVKVIVTCPGRNFVTLKIETDAGVYGVGDATLNGRELAVASYLRDHVVPLLIGRDAHRIEDAWQYLYKGAYWRRGPVTMSAIAAVDTALWDIKGKIAGLPVYQLLGGASRDGVMVYGHACGATIEETVEAARAYLAEGYKAIRLQSGVPGLASTYGVSKDRYFYEPADANLPTENLWSTEKYLRSVAPLFAAARDALGWDVHLLHDVHHRLSPIEAGRLGRDLEPYRPFWMEDATPAENQANYRLIRQHTTTPLAVGEIFNSVWDAKQLIEEQLIDYIRATVVHAGGISHLRRLASFADVHNVRTGCHGATDLSPVCMAAALHFDLSVPNFGIQEYMRHTAETDAVFPHAYSFRDGAMHPGDQPGLGVNIDEALAAKYEYSRSYLPVNRLEDGTMFNW